MKKYDLIVIGSGPAGEKAAVRAAYFLKKVALIEKCPHFGGGATYFTVPSKALRELAVKSASLQFKSANLLHEFLTLKNQVMNQHSKMVHDNLLNHGIDLYEGTAVFQGQHQLQVSNKFGEETLQASHIILAGGVRTLPPEGIPVDGKRIHVVETMFNLDSIPSSLCIAGAGVIGCEYATMFANLGTQVYLLDEDTEILKRFDQEIIKNMLKHMSADGIKLRLGTTIKSLVVPKNKSHKLKLSLSNAEELKVEAFLVAGKRKGQLAELHFEQAGIEIDANGSIPVNEFFQTNVKHVYAVGDVIGNPGLANTGMEQGRYVISHMLELEDMTSFSLITMPQGIYTIPEISTVGISEERAVEQGLDVVTGRSYYTDLARGLILGGKPGLLKLVIERQTQIIIGVHIIGDQASELIHFGVNMVTNRKNLRDLTNANFNFPSLHELYKYAAFDGLGNLTGRIMKKHTLHDVYKY